MSGGSNSGGALYTRVPLFIRAYGSQSVVPLSHQRGVFPPSSNGLTATTLWQLAGMTIGSYKKTVQNGKRGRGNPALRFSVARFLNMPIGTQMRLNAICLSSLSRGSPGINRSCYPSKKRSARLLMWICLKSRRGSVSKKM